MILPLLLAVATAVSSFEDSGFFIEKEGAASGGRAKRQMSRLGTRWNDRQVNYRFSDIDDDKKKTMVAAMNYISNWTCIRFKENPTASQRININAGKYSGCNSKVGAPGTRSSPYGEEKLAYANCPTLGNAVHELSHSLGSFHEHARPDRDNYLIMHQKAIDNSGYAYDLNAQMSFLVNTYVPFQYGSVMMYDVFHYGDRVMTPKNIDYDRTMGNRRVSFYDMDKINQYYECGCKTDLQCQHGGYVVPPACDRCACPKGYFGKVCNQRQVSDSYTLAASPNWQSKTIQFGYKNTGDNYNYFYSSFAYINVPINGTVQVELVKTNNLVCQYGCNVNGIEIKTNSDMKAVSPIICCPDEDLAKKTFNSTNSPTIIEMFNRFENLNVSVTFNYRYV